MASPVDAALETAGGGGRTHTLLRVLDFESCALRRMVDNTAVILPIIDRETQGLAHDPKDGA